jgi:hypothetical protein
VIVKNGFRGTPNGVRETIADLQRIADVFGPHNPPEGTIGRLGILFVVGSLLPWRAVEFERSTRRRRMMCFREPDQIRRLLIERLEWQRADELFVAEHVATGKLTGITTDWVPAHAFDAVFETYRLGTLEHIYQSAPDHVVNLPGSAWFGD